MLTTADRSHLSASASARALRPSYLVCSVSGITYPSRFLRRHTGIVALDGTHMSPSVLDCPVSLRPTASSARLSLNNNQRGGRDRQEDNTAYIKSDRSFDIDLRQQ